MIPVKPICVAENGPCDPAAIEPAVETASNSAATGPVVESLGVSDDEYVRETPFSRPLPIYGQTPLSLSDERLAGVLKEMGKRGVATAACAGTTLDTLRKKEKRFKDVFLTLSTENPALGARVLMWAKHNAAPDSHVKRVEDYNF